MGGGLCEQGTSAIACLPQRPLHDQADTPGSTHITRLRGLLLVTFLVASRPERKRRSPMQEYAPAPGGGAFAQSREYYAELEEWLAGEGAAALQHAELEEQLQARGRELLRRLHQGHLDL